MVNIQAIKIADTFPFPIHFPFRWKSPTNIDSYPPVGVKDFIDTVLVDIPV